MIVEYWVPYKFFKNFVAETLRKGCKAFAHLEFCTCKGMVCTLLQARNSASLRASEQCSICTPIGVWGAALWTWNAEQRSSRASIGARRIVLCMCRTTLHTSNSTLCMPIGAHNSGECMRNRTVLMLEIALHARRTSLALKGAWKCMLLVLTGCAKMLALSACASTLDQ